MDRRDFIKKGCFTCLAIGAGAAMSSLQSCSTLSVIKAYEQDGKIEVDLLQFPADKNVLLLRTSKLEYDILLIKRVDNTYNALYMECTHNANPLSPTSSRILCSLHGSEFDMEGNVKIGPAKEKLRSFPVQLIGNKIIITVS